MAHSGNNKLFTVDYDYIYSIPEGSRAELIDGKVYDKNALTIEAQTIINELTYQLMNAVKKNHKKYKVFPAPFSVHLDKESYTYLKPDISMVCDNRKLINGKFCDGAPELVMEVVSPSTVQLDYILKLNKYNSAGVLEYWIVDPYEKQITVYQRKNNYNNFIIPKTYKITEAVKIGILNNAKIKLSI